jgi:hypothetical protein
LTLPLCLTYLLSEELLILAHGLQGLICHHELNNGGAYTVQRELGRQGSQPSPHFHLFLYLKKSNFLQIHDVSAKNTIWTGWRKLGGILFVHLFVVFEICSPGWLKFPILPLQPSD